MPTTTIQQHNDTINSDYDDNRLIYNEAEKISALSKNGCGVCKRQGFPIFLVRKTVIPKNYRNIDWSAKMVSLGNNNEAVLSDIYQYAYRTLRTGYLYILVKDLDNIYRYLAYEITPSGVFRHKSINDMIEHNIHELPKQCTKQNDHIPGVFVNIDRSLYSGIAYIGYSRRAWSKNALDTYRLAANRNKSEQLTRFTQINLGALASPAPSPQELGTTPQPSRCFEFENFNPSPSIKKMPVNCGTLAAKTAKLMEVTLAEQDVIYLDADTTLQQALKSGRFIPDSFVSAHPFNCFKGNTLRSRLMYDNNVNLVDKLFNHAHQLGAKHGTQISAVVIDDPFAIAEELSLQRQLSIDPIMELISNSETEFSKITAEVFKVKLEGQQDIAKYRQLVEQAIDHYYENHPKEAATIYGEKAQNNDSSDAELTSTDNIAPLNNLSFFDDLYQRTSSRYIQPYQADKEYFTEESLHKRKLIEMINHYKMQLKDYFENKEEFKYHRVFRYTIPSNTGGPTHYGNDIEKLLAQPNLYTQIPISDKDKTRLLEEQKQKNSPLDNTTYDDVAVFKSQSEISKEASIAYKKELDKLEARLKDIKYINEFVEHNNQLFTNISQTIERYSTDYFNYLGWLFGDKQAASPYLPKITQYNQNDFWRIECDQNGSNNHLGYLQDFIKIVDFNVISQVKLPEQYGVWDTLLRDNTTLYYHLFSTDSQISFWHLMSEARLAQDSHSALKDKDKTLSHAIEWVKTHYATQLDASFTPHKGQLILNFYQLIIQYAMSGVVQYHHTLNTNAPQQHKDAKFNSAYFKAHLQDAMLVYNKTYAQFTQVSVPLSQTRPFFEYWSVNYGTFTTDMHSDDLAALQQVRQYQTAGDGSYEFSDKKDIQFVYEFLDLSNTLNSELVNKASIKFTLQNPLKQSVHSDWEQLLSHPKKTSTLKAMGREAFLNAMSLFITNMLIDDNLAKLAATGDAQFGQIYKDQLIEEINKLRVNFVLQTVIALNSSLKFLTKLGQGLAYLKEGINGAQAVNNVLRGTLGSTFNTSLTLTFVAKAATAIFATIEAINAFKGAQKAIDDGDNVLGYTLYVLCTAQALITVLTILNMFGWVPLVGFFAWALALISAVITLVMYIIRDETQDWVPIEVWANRTLFGKNDKPKRWPAYPPNVLGTGIATNDYLTALKGFHANIEFGQKSEAHYANRLPLRVARLNRFEELFSQYKASLESTTDFSQQMIIRNTWFRRFENVFQLPYPGLELIQHSTNQKLMHHQYVSGSLNELIKKQKAMEQALNDEYLIIKTRIGMVDMQGLYLQMTLPNYNPNISQLEAYLHITQGSDTLILSITNDNLYPIITPHAGQLSSVALRGERKEPITNAESEDNTEGVTKNESYDLIKTAKTALETGLAVLAIAPDTGQEEPVLEETPNYKITYKVAELYGKHTIYLKAKYWPEGKTKTVKDDDGNDKVLSLTPLVQAYDYQQD